MILRSESNGPCPLQQFLNRIAAGPSLNDRPNDPRYRRSAQIMGVNDQPLVSVITPVYNGDQYLRECIESVLAQTYSNWVYTIVNNCSTDGTLAIAGEYAQRDKRIRIYSNDSLLDIIANHNRAFRLISADSKYCKVVSADDWLFPECLTKMVGVAEANPSVGL